MEWGQIIVLVAALVWLLKVFDKYLTSLSAISFGLTLNEFTNTWNYKYLFEIRHGKYYHRKLSFFGMIKNLITFLFQRCCCLRNRQVFKRHR